MAPRLTRASTTTTTCIKQHTYREACPTFHYMPNTQLCHERFVCTHIHEVAQHMSCHVARANALLRLWRGCWRLVLLRTFPFFQNFCASFVSDSLLVIARSVFGGRSCCVSPVALCLFVCSSDELSSLSAVRQAVYRVDMDNLES